MQLTDTYLEMEDNEMEIDQNFSAESSIAIESYAINKMPRPNIALLLTKPDKKSKTKFKYEEWEDIERITGNPSDQLNPPRQSTPKLDEHFKKLTARRLF